MKGTIDAILADLQASGNLRTVALTDADAELVDLSSNDYLGLAASAQLREDFFKRKMFSHCLCRHRLHVCLLHTKTHFLRSKTDYQRHTGRRFCYSTAVTTPTPEWCRHSAPSEALLL